MVKYSNVKKKPTGNVVFADTFITAKKPQKLARRVLMLRPTSKKWKQTINWIENWIIHVSQLDFSHIVSWIKISFILNVNFLLLKNQIPYYTGLGFFLFLKN